MGWKVRAYYNVNPFVGVSWHDTMITIPLPPFMIPGKLPHISFTVVQGLWLGSFLSNGRDRQVISDDLLFLGRMSDAGLVVPHISIPPSWYNLLTTLFGSSNALFGSSSVSIACKNILWGNEDCDLATSPFPVAPVSLNLSCWDPFSLPTDIVVLWGTVYASMSLVDLLAALIDLAIQWAVEGLMFFGGKALQKGLGKLGKKLASTGAKKAGKKVAQKSVKKGIFAAFGDKVVSAFKKATGATASDAYASYLKKAADCKGIMSALDMTDDDLAKFVKKTGGFSEAFGDVAENLSAGYKKFGSKYGKQVKGVNKAFRDALRDASSAVKASKSLSSVTDDMATDIVKKTMLTEALEELDEVVKKVAKEEVIFQLELKLVTKGLASLYKNIVRYGNAFGSGTEGGIFSFDGAGWTGWFGRTMQFEDRFSWNLADSLVADEAAIDNATEDDDYWYSSEEDSTVESEEDDDDYWYESEPAEMPA